MKNSFFKNTTQPDENISAIAAIEIPGPVYATTGSLPGEIFLQWDSINSARKYVIEISSKLSEKWQQVDIIKDPLYCITGLKPSTEYCFRVAAIYPEGVGPWSKTVSKRSK
jgi:hypothetical protein